VLIVTHGRSGATKYCLDLEKLLGIPFVGEFDGSHLKKNPWAGTKAKNHETGFQPSYGEEEFFDIIRNHKNNCIVQLNRAPANAAPQADKILIRKDIYKTLVSFAKLLARTGLENSQILFFCKLLFDDYMGLVTYTLVAKQRNLAPEVLWFEELYPNHVQDEENILEIIPEASKYFEWLISSSGVERLVHRCYTTKILKPFASKAQNRS